MPIPTSNYLRDLGVKGIVRLTSHWKELAGGYQDEITTEEISCLKEGLYIRMTVVWTKKFFPTNSISAWIQNETQITQEEYERIRKENGDVLDTPELVQAINRRIELGRALRELVPACPKCGNPMTTRSGKRGDFWGCTQYPKCKGTLDWDNNLAKQRDAIKKELEKYQDV